MAQPYIGQIIMFGGTFAIRTFAFCDGQLLVISSNTALFSLLGTTYGGDGKTTFALPDLRARAPVHPGNAPGLDFVRLGEKYGAQEITLNVAQLPPHSHAAAGGGTVATTDSGVSITPSGTNNTLAEVDSGAFNVNIYAPAGGTQVELNSNPVQIGNTGSGIPVPIEGPRLAVNFEIALTGIYPSHN